MKGTEMTDTYNRLDIDAADPNYYWTDPHPEWHTQVTCPGCGAEVDIDGPLEDAHFVFAMRRNLERIKGMERSNLGNCPREHGFDETVRRMRMYLGLSEVYYRGHAL